MSDDEKEQTLEINWVQAVAGALAAMSSAVLLSTVGVTGTIIGAAIGSVIATVGSAVYSYYLRVTKQRIAEAHAAAFARVARAHDSVSGASADVDTEPTRAGLELEQAERELRQAEEELRAAEAAPSGVRWRELLAGLPWKRIAVVAGAIFALVMLVILTFELITGRAVSTYTGGTEDDSTRTSIPGLGGGDERERDREPEPTDEPTEDPTEEPSQVLPTEPTTEPTPTVEPTTATPSPTSEPTLEAPSVAPTTQPPAPTTSPTP